MKENQGQGQYKGKGQADPGEECRHGQIKRICWITVFLFVFGASLMAGGITMLSLLQQE